MKYLIFYFKRFKRYAGKIFYFNLVAAFIVSLLQGMETFLVIPLISISGIIDVDLSAKPIFGIFKFLQNYLKPLGLLPVLGIYILLVVGQSLLQRNINTRNQIIQYGFLIKLKQEIHRAILLAKWDFFIKRKQSDIVSSLTSEFARVGSGLLQILQLLTAAIFTVIQIGLALWLSAKLTIFVLLCGFIYVFVTRKFVKRIREIGILTSEIARIYLGGISDQLNGIKDIKINNLEESNLLWLDSITKKSENEQKEYMNLRNSSEVWSKILSAVFISIIIYVSVRMFRAQWEQLLLIVLVFFRLWPRLTSIQFSVNQIASNIPAFKELAELEKECKEAQELEVIKHFENTEPLVFKQGIECRNVFFRYDTKESIYTLHDINLHIPVNATTAIVGPSGAGKSTLIDILLGLLHPEKGQVLIDGTPLNFDNVLALRQSASCVPQAPFLFNASIRDNMLLTKPNATETDLWEALEFSAAAEFVKKLPNGLDTIVGDRGIRVSGGERQRLVLARAILRKPFILVLDEATSSLDIENETKIQKVLDNLKGMMTVIIVAHRLTTIRNADQVIVLDQGRIIQKGDFSQLLQEKKGLFSNLLGIQMRGLTVATMINND